MWSLESFGKFWKVKLALSVALSVHTHKAAAQFSCSVQLCKMLLNLWPVGSSLTECCFQCRLPKFCPFSSSRLRTVYFWILSSNLLFIHSFPFSFYSHMTSTKNLSSPFCGKESGRHFTNTMCCGPKWTRHVWPGTTKSKQTKPPRHRDVNTLRSCVMQKTLLGRMRLTTEHQVRGAHGERHYLCTPALHMFRRCATVKLHHRAASPHPSQPGNLLSSWAVGKEPAEEKKLFCPSAHGARNHFVQSNLSKEEVVVFLCLFSRISLIISWFKIKKPQLLGPPNTKWRKDFPDGIILS